MAVSGKYSVPYKVIFQSYGTVRRIGLQTCAVGKKQVKMDIKVGNIVRLKKQHPCGSSEWEVLRIGADFRLKCLGCGHQIMIARKLVEKNVKEIKEST